jgi:uncharacterized membrane protein
MERDTRIDILRGLAIFTMVAANMSAHSLIPPHEFMFRLYGSVAAPLFIFLSGMMVSHTTLVKSHGPWYYFKRCLAVLAVAAFIDTFLWRVAPVSTFDVLYIIAVSAPIIYFFNKLHLAIQILLAASCIGLAPVLQYYFGYLDYPVEISLAEQSIAELVNVPVLHQFLIDGWFPVFPWLGVAMAGAIVGRLKLQKNFVTGYTIVIVGIAALTAGVILWVIQDPILMEREGYSELFYPPTVGYMLCMLGSILVLIRIIYGIPVLVKVSFLSSLGKSSLLVYLLHTVNIVFIFNQLPAFGPATFTALYILHTIVLWLICLGVQRLIKGQKLPFMARLILGG